MIKVHFEKESGKIKGYYPDSINYSSIPEPFIEIEDSAQILDKEMRIVDGVYQEYLEPLDVQLKVAKDLKFSELKKTRDLENIKPILETKASQILADGTLGEEIYFTFYTDRHPTNPAADPSSILTGVIVTNIPTPYSTKTPEGERVLINITPEKARGLVSHLALRNQNNYFICDLLSKKVKDSSSLEEVKAVSWDLNILT